MTKQQDIPDDKASEVFELAARLQSEQAATYTRNELAQAGREADILPEFIDAALHQIQERENLIRTRQLNIQKRMHLLRVSAMIVGLIAIIGTALTYNLLATSSQQVDLAWAQVENQFQRRSDLIPNLLAATEQGARRQQELAATLSAARSSYLAAQSRPQKIEAAAQMDKALQQYSALIVSANPLASNQLYVGLQDELAGTENRIATERRRYNQAVASYNTTIRVFPSSLVARVFGFRDKPMFVADDASVPQLSP